MKVGDKIRYVNKMELKSYYCITEYDGIIARKEVHVGWEGYICYIFQNLEEVWTVVAARLLFSKVKYPVYFCHSDKSVESPSWCADFSTGSIELVKEENNKRLCNCEIVSFLRNGCTCGGD